MEGKKSSMDQGGPRTCSEHWQPAEHASGRGWAILIFIKEQSEVDWLRAPSALNEASELQAAHSEVPFTPALPFHPKSHLEKSSFKVYYN